MIKSIRIENFQSHKDTFITFSPNVTSIIGLNNHGKSVILRALAKVIRDEPAGTDFIMDTPVREDECRVTIETDKGTVVRLVKRNASSTGNNMYKIIKGENVTEFSNFSKSGIPVEVLEVLDVSEPVSFGDIELDVNFHHQLDTLFLMQGPGLPSLRGKVIGKVVNIDNLQRAIQLGASEEKQLKKTIHSIETDLENNRQQLLSFDYLDILKNSVDYTDSLFNQYTFSEEKKKKLEELSIEVKKIVTAAKLQNDKINLINSLNESLLPDINGIYEKLQSLKRISQLFQTINYYQHVYNSVSIEYDINHPLLILSKINSLKNIFNLTNALDSVKERCNVPIDIDLTDVETRLNYLRNLQVSYNNSVLYHNNYTKNEVIAANYQEDLLLADQEFEKLKEELKVCPLCQRSLL